MVNSSMEKKKIVVINNKIPKSEVPPGTNIYHSTFQDQAKSIMDRKVGNMYVKSMDPVKHKVINKNFAYDKDIVKTNKIKSLTGEYIDEMDFVHQNMTPYFGGRIRQNMSDDANKSILDTFTGVSSTDYKKKCEVASFYDQSKDLTNINGMENRDDFYRERMVVSNIQNNITPVDKVYVGPGLNQGYSSKPTGGFQQLDLQELVMPKCVDQLRAANKPKMTYDGRVLDGMKSKMRGDVGKVEKNRVETWYEQTPDHYLRTTGAFLKQTQIPEHIVNPTNRLDTTREYIGSAINTGAKARRIDPLVKATDRNQLEEYGIRNARVERFGVGEKDDYGKSKIMVYDNERDITSTRVYQGNVTSLIKAVVSPLMDIFKDTKKEEMIDNPRHFGNMQLQIPDKGTVYDPNDIARTTIKETTIHETVNGNLKGNTKSTVHDPNDIARTTTKETTVHESISTNLKGSTKSVVHDPNDIARTTTKETTIHETVNGNLKGSIKSVVHDPNDIARTTTKETTIHDYIAGNLKGYEKLTIYDPNDIARTTIKETLIHDDIGTGTITGPKQLFVYDPDEVAKTTIRETLDSMEYEMNLQGGARKGKVYDPDDVARTTMKETLADKTREGNIDRVEGMGDYNTTNYDAKKTQKQFLSDGDYYGVATRSDRDGYKVANFDAPHTQKEFLSDIEYFGGAEASSDKKPKSYEDMYNAEISASQESILYGREPTNSGKKSTIGSECISIAHRKQECDNVSERYTNNIDKISNEIPSLEDNSLTRMKKTYKEDDRLDPALLKAYLENPYTKPLNSFA